MTEVWYDMEYNKFHLAETAFLSDLYSMDCFMVFIGVL